MLGTQPPAPTREQPPKTITDPDSLAAREDVDHRHNALLHEAADHCAAGIAGRAVVGIRDADGRLLVVSNGEHAVSCLPHGDVAPDGDWIAAARDGVADRTGLAVEVTDVRLVRTVDHFVVGEDGVGEDAGFREEPPAGLDRQLTTHNVLLAGQPVEGSTIDRDANDGDWIPEWVTGLPENPAPGTPAADLEYLVE